MLILHALITIFMNVGVTLAGLLSSEGVVPILPQGVFHISHALVPGSRRRRLLLFGSWIESNRPEPWPVRACITNLIISNLEYFCYLLYWYNIILACWICGQSGCTGNVALEVGRIIKYMIDELQHLMHWLMVLWHFLMELQHYSCNLQWITHESIDITIDALSTEIAEWYL